MKADLKSGEGNDLFAHDVMKAQAVAILDRTRVTILTNAIVAASTVLVSMIGRGLTSPVLAWFAVVVGTLILRFWLRQSLQKADMAEKAPQRVLARLAAGAFSSGIAWSALPFIIPDYNALGSDGSIYLVMCGIATGAVLMGIGSSRISLAFALPIHAAVVASLAITLQPIGLLLALNIVGLTIVLFRSAHVGEAIFIDNVIGKSQATALAFSLSEANSDILRANYRLETLANHDPLTRLANRAAFNTALTSGIVRAQTQDERLALLILDLDRFKGINDTLGHSAGDALLVEVSERLRAATGAAGLIARLGGDEFAVIVSGPTAAETAREHAEIILQRVCQPAVLDGQPTPVGASIGLALFPDHAATAEDLFISADMALYRAKDGGRRQWCEFDPAFRSQADRQHQIEQELADALAEGTVEAWFQPQVELESGQIVGFEALVRWHHPYLGPISPPEIVLAAQAVNHSDRLTALIADAACRLLSRLPSLGLPQATVAINVSPLEFDLYSVTDVLDRITQAHGIDPALFEIEITEEAILDPLVAGEQLKRIERSGYKLAVDDFGAGHSSLAYLVSLKVDRLKLDRRFVTGIDRSRQNQEIVGALIGLGRALSMEVMAEGVESEEEAVALKALGCPIVQGYFFARPMPADRIPGWVESRQALTGRRVA